MARERGVEALHAAAAVLLAFGVVSLLGDASYEGLRSILPVEVKATLELGGLVGVGEAIAYGLRGVAGVVAEATGSLWTPVFAGYGLVPVGVLIALYGGETGLAAGYWLERLGKAVRTPARDALLREAAPHGRRGLFFGVHEALDQLGAVAGPVLASLVVAGKAPAWLLAVPGAATVPVLIAARSLYSRLGVEPPRGFGSVKKSIRESSSAAAAVMLLGTLVPSPIVVAHLAGLAGYSDAGLPLLYAAAMASDALAAVPLGLLYDRAGARGGLAAMAAAGAATVAAVASRDWLLAALLTGIVEAGYETVARAMARGAAGYGLLGLARGVSSGGSIALYGLLYSGLAGG